MTRLPKVLGIGLLTVAFGFALIAAAPVDSSIHRDVVIDGSFVHDVGRLQVNITNWGLIGSQYSAPSSFADAPSGRWPGADGIDHLFAAGLWVGGVLNGETHVSTGQYATEFRPLDGPEATIYRLSYGAPQASRYPLPFADDDSDGLENEDPFNGRDDDGDGLVDEDDAGIADQHFRAEMDDMHATDVYPDHVPLDLDVAQQSVQWTYDELADGVGFEYTLHNVGDATIDDVYVGMFSDFDINDPPGLNEGVDDMAGFISGTVEPYPGQTATVDVAYMVEGVGRTTSGYMGWAVLGHPTDPTGATAPTSVGARGFRHFAGSLSYVDGGDPTNDNERYDALSSTSFDAGTVEPDDYRVLIGVGPFASLAPGESLSVAFAMVAGATLDDLLLEAGRMRLAYEGRAFDRDGDPANGDEFVVRWLAPEEDPVSTEGDIAPGTPPADRSLRLSAAPNPFNPRLELMANLSHAGPVRVSIFDVKGRLVRVLRDGAAPAGESRWSWDGRDAGGRPLASGVYRVTLTTPERVLERTVTMVK